VQQHPNRKCPKKEDLDNIKEARSKESKHLFTAERNNVDDSGHITTGSTGS